MALTLDDIMKASAPASAWILEQDCQRNWVRTSYGKGRNAAPHRRNAR